MSIDGEAVALSHLEVRLVVGRGDLHGARAEAALHGRVGDDLDVAVHERDPHPPADERAVALIVRMDRHGRVAEERLRAGGGDRDRRVRVGLRRSPRR